MNCHRYYLEAMGIERWRLRSGVAPAPATAASASPGDEQVEPVPAPPGEAGAGERPAAPPVDAASQEPDAGVATPAIAAMDWAQLEQAVANCQACALHASRTRPVFGVGSHQADWMIIGEAPGAEEDRLGEPFVGRAGKLLDLMLAAVGLARERVYIANILKSRPPGNRDPKPDEIKACWPYLMRQIELVQPRLLLVMGRIAAQSLLQTDTPVGRLRGRAHQFQGRPLIVTYHPAYLLRSPQQKAKSWQDLQLAQRLLRATMEACQ